MLLRHARHLLLRCASALGATRYVADSAWRRRRLVILCYHGISLDDEHEWNPELYMPAAQFRARMRQLREGGYNVLPLREAVELLYAGELPPRSVVVTFDDGCYDFQARALPVLREFDIPATNFIATFYSRFGRPVFDTALAYLLWKGRARGRISVAGMPDDMRSMPIATAEDRTRVWQVLYTHAQRAQLSAGEKDALLAAVATELGIDYEAWVSTRMLQQMRMDEIHALPRELVDVQLHTHRHRMPTDRQRFAREIADNRDALGDTAPDDAPRAHFCYPSGRYDLRAARWLAELGVRSAVTCEADICSPQDHPLILPRYTDTALQTDAVFDGWISGLYPLLPWTPRQGERRRHRRTALSADGAATPRAVAPAVDRVLAADAR
jgi:peptidoglycan/xylan/chitin deacetylase (PgdA/CDA1 family)